MSFCFFKKNKNTKSNKLEFEKPNLIDLAKYEIYQEEINTRDYKVELKNMLEYQDPMLPKNWIKNGESSMEKLDNHYVLVKEYYKRLIYQYYELNRLKSHMAATFKLADTNDINYWFLEGISTTQQVEDYPNQIKLTNKFYDKLVEIQPIYKKLYLEYCNKIYNLLVKKYRDQQFKNKMFEIELGIAHIQ